MNNKNFIIYILIGVVAMSLSMSAVILSNQKTVEAEELPIQVTQIESDVEPLEDESEKVCIKSHLETQMIPKTENGKTVLIPVKLPICDEYE
ncbi:hypothetical protein [Nitrososphaeria virus YSH_1032793]|uniref:Uncharacterized protein n=1 Tax=Nitrososphaeria virus YSH_1032793 TaxID=3071320 RepID=A0A976UAD2_9CAUD|nr:hypothetical protein QKV91_gp46 [Yangshan Harbor Nitrososphaeria virus]UVF62250.1 hypothetical protein [Nitrososphaeria virus YSH_1032793]